MSVVLKACELSIASGIALRTSKFLLLMVVFWYLLLFYNFFITGATDAGILYSFYYPVLGSTLCVHFLFLFANVEEIF